MTLDQARQLSALLTGDDDAARLAALNAPKQTPRERYVDYVAMANLLGFAATAGIRAVLAESADASMQTIHQMLAGRGIDMGNAQTRELVPQFVLAGVLTHEQADTLLAEGVTITPSDAATVLDRDATADDLAEMRAWLERDAACDALEQTATNWYASVMNDQINPARSSLSNPLPVIVLPTGA